MRQEAWRTSAYATWLRKLAFLKQPSTDTSQAKRIYFCCLLRTLKRRYWMLWIGQPPRRQDPLHSLENVLKAHLSYVEQRRGVSLIVISETLRLADMNLRKRMFEVVNRYLSRIEELLAQGIKSGQISQEIDLGTAALTFFAIIHTTVTLWALSNSGFSLARRHKPLWDSYIANIAVSRSSLSSTWLTCTPSTRRRGQPS